MRYEVKYLERLASVYMDQYDLFGYEAAQEWFKGFLTDDLQDLIRPYITEEVQRRPKENKNDTDT